MWSNRIPEHILWQLKYCVVAIATDLRRNSINDVEGFQPSCEFQCDIFISYLNTKVILKLLINM